MASRSHATQIEALKVHLQNQIKENNRIAAERDAAKQARDIAQTEAGRLLEVLRTIAYLPAEQGRRIARAEIGEPDETAPPPRSNARKLAAVKRDA